MARFWVYIDAKIQGPVDIPALRKVGGFNLLTQVCLEGEQTWRMADEVIEIKSYFLSPPRLNSFALDTGNAAPKLELAPILEELTLPEPNTLEIISAPLTKKKNEATLQPGLAAMPSGQTPTPSGAAGLRAVCDVCGYKNPRDVTVCMKCGESLKGAAAPKAAAEGPAAQPVIPLPTAAQAPTPEPIPIPSPAPAIEIDAKSSTMVEIPMSRLLLWAAAAVLVTGGSFFGYRSWKKKHPSKTASESQAPDVQPSPTSQTSPVSNRRIRTARARARKTTKHYTHRPIRHISPEEAAALPGLSRTGRPAPSEPIPEKSEAASYRVVPEASPIQKRYSSPINSTYAVKRRANQELWTTQEGRAIQQVQRQRIYGGMRTIERNTEILMQILRDREYNTAFESGKRIYLYDDMDWSAVQKEGPTYEVRLTFSGGREADGSPKKQLHFAFASDLERGTVEPGGQDQVHSNTLHAFFDESRIAPEDRRAIAKDTEELVLAAQPGASPLALDTVVRQFAKVYGTDALSRVAGAYGLGDIKKKLAHDPRLGSDEAADAVFPTTQSAKAAAPVSAVAPSQAAPEEANVKPAPPFSAMKGNAVEFRMEAGSGRERTFLVRATSRASATRLWETLTGYDRLKQFVPDMLASEREGQDGAAVIVHTVCLTRLMFFVFKLNLHLRIIEHPQQHQLEFERIAGEFESFRGSIDVVTDPVTHDSQIAFRATLVPSGHTMNWALESMARRLLVEQLDAIRTKAETN